MKQQPVPIKRSKELAPLSREHHDGLQFVWKIRQGLENGSSIEVISRYVSWFWLNHIKPHFNDEEKVLLQYLPSKHPLVKQMIDEHAQIRELILLLGREADKENLKKLADFINNHIRFEERELFAYAEETLTKDELQHILSQIEEHPACDTEWKEEFWLRAKS